MNADLLFPSDYIAAADLLEARKQSGAESVTLTISNVALEDLRTRDGGKQKKPIVYFAEMIRRNEAGKGENKRLVLNKTNKDTIKALYGRETEGWAGMKVDLFPSRCLAFGEMVDCVRIRDKKPAAPSAKSKHAAPKSALDKAIEEPPGAEPIKPVPASEWSSFESTDGK